MGRHLTVSPAEGESLDAFAERMAKKVAEHFGTSPTAPVPQDSASGDYGSEPPPEGDQPAD